MEMETGEHLLFGEVQGKAPSVVVYFFVLPFTPLNFKAALATQHCSSTCSWSKCLKSSHKADLRQSKGRWECWLVLCDVSFSHKAEHRAATVTLGLASSRNERVSLLLKLRSVSLSGKQYAVSYCAEGNKSVWPRILSCKYSFLWIIL